MPSKLKNLLSGLFAKPATGAVVVGPQMFSRTVVYMSADPIIVAARRAIEDLDMAEELAALDQFDSVMDCLKRAKADLMAGLPDARLITETAKQ